MNVKSYVGMMRKLLNCFENDYSGDQNLQDWNHALLEFMDRNLNEFCPSCGGTGYYEEQLDVDEFEQHPCPDCRTTDDILNIDYDPPNNEYAEWAGIEEPYKEPIDL